MSFDWRAYWDTHARTTGSDEPLRRVQRTIDRRPIASDQLDAAIAHVLTQLRVDTSHAVLDLCCGNGLLTTAVAPLARLTVGVDFCEDLIADMSRDNAHAVVADARDVAFRPQSFDRVLFAAALQHFEPSEIARIFRMIVTTLRPGGVLLVTDVPDHARKWAFFDTPERERALFTAVEAGVPILGTWFERTWLEKLGRHVGFRTCSAIDQPDELPFAHYRFDLRCEK